MRHPSALFTTALLALAIAQTQAAETQIDSATEETVELKKAELKDKDNGNTEQVEELTVTGIRASMEKAQDIKKILIRLWMQ